MATQLNNSGVLFPDSTTQISAGLTPGNWNTVSSGGATTLVPGGRYYLTSAGVTATLPASPAVGTQVTVAVGQNNTTSVIATGGQNIMGFAQNMTIDIANIAVTMEFMGGAIGWQVF